MEKSPIVTLQQKPSKPPAYPNQMQTTYSIPVPDIYCTVPATPNNSPATNSLSLLDLGTKLRELKKNQNYSAKSA
jgi:hypothetical protein